MSDLPAFPKPSQSEGKITLSEAQRAKKRKALFFAQNGLCCTCNRRMTLEPYYTNTATLGHRNPQPAGCAKRDNDDNLLGAQCWACNTQRGSKRD